MLKLFLFVIRAVLYLPFSILYAFIVILSNAAHGKVPGQRFGNGRRCRW